MAEAMELDLTLKKLVDETIKNPIATPPDLIKNKDTEESDKYSIKSYYEDDTLGVDVLKQKYLAPWEKHPYEMWHRQAEALASVEKTKSKILHKTSETISFQAHILSKN